MTIPSEQRDLGSTQDITPLTLMDDGQRTATFETRGGAAGRVVWGSNLPIFALVRLSCWSSESGLLGGSPDELEGVMAGLVLAIHVVRRIECSRARQGESFVPTKLCCGPPHAGPFFEALPAWMAGTSPAMTARAETNNDRKSRFFLY
jgi:hypothetical protein